MKTTEIKKQEQIVIDEDQLRNVIEAELDNAYNFGMTGCRIPIYVDDDGTVSAGGWLSNNSYQPGEREIIGIESWTIDIDMDEYAKSLDKNVEDLTEDDKESLYDEEKREVIDRFIERIQEKINLSNAENEEDFEIIIEDLDHISYQGQKITVYENEDSEKIIKFITYNELRNDLKVMFESLKNAFEDEEGNIIFVTDTNSYIQ